MVTNSEQSSDNFEHLRANPFFCNNHNILLQDDSDPDCHLLNESNLNIDTPYLSADEAKNTLQKLRNNSGFSAIHINLRSINKNFNNLTTFLNHCDHEFSIIALTESWHKTGNSNYNLHNYNVVHLPRDNKTGGGICVFVHNSLMFKVRHDLSVSNENNESLFIEIINKNSKNLIVGTTYRPPSGKLKPFKNDFKSVLKKLNNKHIYLLGDYNINALLYNEDNKIKEFFNMMFAHGMISIINKPTRVSRKSATAIDHIFTNNFFDRSVLTGIIKYDLSDHFPIFVADNKVNVDNFPKETIIQRRRINDENIAYFKRKLLEINWDSVLNFSNPNDSYNNFINIFSKLYDDMFPIKVITIKTKSWLRPWITKGIMKSSKQKQKLYNKFLKNRTFFNETNYKYYKNLFEKI